MKDSLTLYNRDDFRQRYKGSFGFLSNNGVRTLVHISEVSAKSVAFKTDTDGLNYYANAGAGVDFEFLPVTRSWYDLGDKPALLFRVPARQYCRGISSGNTSCLIPGLWGLDSVPLTLEILSKVFVTPAVTTLAQFLAKEKNYFLLGRAFCIHENKLYFFSKAIGAYADGVITITNPLVYQELIDVIARQQYPFTVKVDHDSV
jgi:hypothetical protein